MNHTRHTDSLVVLYVAIALMAVIVILVVGPTLASVRSSEAKKLVQDTRYEEEIPEARVDEFLEDIKYPGSLLSNASQDNEYRHLITHLARQYPFESLEDRLSGLRHNQRIEAPKLSSEAREELDDFEWIDRLEPITKERPSRTTTVPNYRRVPSRGILLKQLHEGTVEDFVKQNGVGIYRVESLVEPKHPLVVDHNPSNLKPMSQASSEASKDLVPLDNRHLKQAHQIYRDSFVFEEGWGYVRSKSEVAGFIPHRFGNVTLRPRDLLDRGAVNNHDVSDWHVASLKLVSLLMHDSPQVYELDKLPDMADVKSAPTRPLSQWETTSLKNLYAGENVCIENGDSQIRMFGAIRANKECLQCHDVNRGDLLGAFTYEIVPLAINRK